ncbi:MAG: hypothetical protein V3G42_12535 [Oscillospiraceae bacterium]
MSELKQNIRKISSQNSSMLLMFLVITLVLSIILSTLKGIGILGEEFHAEMLVSGVLQYLVALPLSILIMRSSKNGKSIPNLKETFRKPQATKKEIAKWIMISLLIVGLVFSLLSPLVAYICCIISLVLSIKHKNEFKIKTVVILDIVGLVVAVANNIYAVILLSGMQ